MRRKAIQISILIICFQGILDAQSKNDYIWVLGYPPNIPDEFFGGVLIDFNTDIAFPKYFNINCDAVGPAVLSSYRGRLLAYSDGCRIYNAEHEVMHKGDSISFGAKWVSCEDGYRGTQNHLLLSWPGDTSKAVLFHIKVADNSLTHYLQYSRMEFTDQYPLGNVTEKNINLLDPGTSQLITATRHGNGRDWWLIFPEDQTNRFFSILVDPSGVSVVDTQSIGTPWGPREWASQAIFSPDGSKYIRFNPWKGLDICDFDRCAGELSNMRESGPFSDPVEVGGGVAVSSDSHILYVSNTSKLFQFDLTSPDILSTKTLIGEYDGYGDPFATSFYQMMLAPDGKIYIFSSNGSRSLHVINYPERTGVACGFVQHALQLPAYVDIGSINLPYYRLGPVDGSSCDTLDINNLPIADFRYEIDSLNPLRVHLNNLSYFEPTIFSWTFGNNTTSDLKHPGPIEYSSYGIYEVCLTAANEYGSHTFCRSINLHDSISSVDNAFQNYFFHITPNPFTSHISVTINDHFSNLDFIIYSTFGEEVYSYKLNKKENDLTIPGLSNGLYFYCIRQKGNILQSGKLIKTE